MEQRKGQRVILFPLPLQGHLNSMLQLANLLYSKGFSITIIHTHFNSPNPEKHPSFTFPSIPDGLNNVNATQLASSAIVDDVIVLLSLLNTNYVKPFSDCLSELLFSSSSINNVSDHEEPIACLINDAVWHFSQAVADHLRIPRLVILWTSSVSSFVGFTSIPFPLEKDYVPIKGAYVGFVYFK